MAYDCHYCRTKNKILHLHHDCPETYKGEEKAKAIDRYWAEIARRRAALKPMAAYPHLRGHIGK